MTDYCEIAKDHPLHGPYHDHEYGFPQTEDTVLFERLILELNQAGLSWATILKKRDGFTKAYEGFNIQKIALYQERDIERLLSDKSIIRNRLKIKAAIYNANQVIKLQNEFGSFKAWLDHHHPKQKKEWVILFRKTFKFMGPEIVGEFLMSLGYLPGAHHQSCPIYKEIEEDYPPFISQTAQDK